MKIYISLPITGHDLAEARERAEKAKTEIEANGHTPVSPLDLCTDPSATYSEHMGRDIATLLECDAVMFLDGWRASLGCRLEHAAADIYGKILIY